MRNGFEPQKALGIMEAIEGETGLNLSNYLCIAKNKVHRMNAFDDDNLYRKVIDFNKAYGGYDSLWWNGKDCNRLKKTLEKVIAVAKVVVQEGKAEKFFTELYATADNPKKVTLIKVCVELNYKVEESVQLLKELIAGGENSFNPKMLKYAEETL